MYQNGWNNGFSGSIYGVKESLCEICGIIRRKENVFVQNVQNILTKIF